MSDVLRRALSDHDMVAPLTVEELLALATEIEEDLIANECNFSHPGWRQVDGLRATARKMTHD